MRLPRHPPQPVVGGLSFRPCCDCRISSARSKPGEFGVGFGVELEFSRIVTSLPFLNAAGRTKTKPVSSSRSPNTILRDNSTTTTAIKLGHTKTLHRCNSRALRGFSQEGHAEERGRASKPKGHFQAIQAAPSNRPMIAKAL
jgi:hypothetical protein